MNTNFEIIKDILTKYKNEKNIFHETIEELITKGIPQGCYQNYALLFDIVRILYICEDKLKNLV